MERISFAKKILNLIPHQQVAFLASAIFIVGLLAGRAVMSIGMILLLANALINLKLPDILKKFVNNKTALLFVGLFLLLGLSVFWTTNTAYYSSRMQLMLPFLAIPLAFQAVKWKQQYFDYLAILFIGVCALGAGWSLVQYAQEKDAIDAAYRISKNMPTPFQNDHIRFGVAVVMAISFCFQLIKKNVLPKVLLILLALFLIFYTHLLASKTALLSLYIISLYEIILLILKKKKFLWGVVLLLTVAALPFIFYQISSSFRNKMIYTKYSFEQLSNDKAETNISDEGRIVSYRAAGWVYEQHWLLGVGLGDGLDEMKAEYQRSGVSTEKILYPHNEFLYIALILGTVGLIYFLFLLFYIVRRHFLSSPWMANFFLIFFVPLMVEAFFNTQYGIALFVFFFFLLERRSESVA